MRKVLISLQAIYPPLLLGALTLLVVFCGLGSYYTFFRYLGAIGSLLFFTDAFNRFKGFKRTVKRIREGSHSHESILHINRKAWCTRESTIAAFKVVSKKNYKKGRKYYKKMGYRAWHIFPENTFTKKSPWMKKKFYKETFLSFLKK